MADEFINMPPEMQIKLKKALEKRFKPEIKKVFAGIRKKFILTVITSGVQPAVMPFLSVWRTLLEGHYQRVQNAFLKTITLKNTEKQKLSKEDEEKEKLLLLALLAWREQNVNQTASELSFTTQTNMTEAIEKARSNFAVEGLVPTDRELAFAAAVILRKKFNARVGSIAMTETQKAAESTKIAKAEVESGIRPTVLGGETPSLTTIKIWWTRLDARVRRAHQRVHGQKQLLKKPFVVPLDGRRELLRFPGDTSLGASIGNIANCRCVSLYRKVKNFVPLAA